VQGQELCKLLLSKVKKIVFTFFLTKNSSLFLYLLFIIVNQSTFLVANILQKQKIVNGYGSLIKTNIFIEIHYTTISIP